MKLLLIALTFILSPILVRILSLVLKLCSSASLKRNEKIYERNYELAKASLQRRNLNDNGFYIIGSNSSSVDVELKQEDGYGRTGEKYHLKIRRGKVVKFMPYDTNRDIRNNRSVSMDQLIERYSQKLSQEAKQLSLIEQQIRDEGEVTIYAQSFNNNTELTRREMKALVEALKEDNFKVTRTDYLTGEISLAIGTF